MLPEIQRHPGNPTAEPAVEPVTDLLILILILISLLIVLVLVLVLALAISFPPYWVVFRTCRSPDLSPADPSCRGVAGDARVSSGRRGESWAPQAAPLQVFIDSTTRWRCAWPDEVTLETASRHELAHASAQARLHRLTSGGSRSESGATGPPAHRHP